MKGIPLGKHGHITLVDDSDFIRLSTHKWHRQRGGLSKMFYAIRWEWDGKGNRTKYIAMHREILGVTEPKITIDHRDRNGLNNQRSNLRICPRKGFNQANQPAMRGRKWKGCGRLSQTPHRWRARIASKHIGTFATEEEAARAYDKAALKIYGEFAYLNFP